MIQTIAGVASDQLRGIGPSDMRHHPLDLSDQGIPRTSDRYNETDPLPRCPDTGDRIHT